MTPGRAAIAGLAVAALTIGASPFHDASAGPRALPGDRLPPFAMIDDKGNIALDPPPLPPGAHLPQPGDPPESSAAAPSLAEAMRIAQTALRECTAHGFRVGVAVVDSAGEARAMLTADGADGSHVFVGQRKALVALAFDRPSFEVHSLLQRDPGQSARLTPAMFVEGGAVPIHRGGRLIGAIGVSGAAGIPIGRQDDTCARAGLAALGHGRR